MLSTKPKQQQKVYLMKWLKLLGNNEPAVATAKHLGKHLHCEGYVYDHSGSHLPIPRSTDAADVGFLPIFIIIARPLSRFIINSDPTIGEGR